MKVPESLALTAALAGDWHGLVARKEGEAEGMAGCTSMGTKATVLRILHTLVLLGLLYAMVPLPVLLRRMQGGGDGGVAVAGAAGEGASWLEVNAAAIAAAAAAVVVELPRLLLPALGFTPTVLMNGFVAELQRRCGGDGATRGVDDGVPRPLLGGRGAEISSFSCSDSCTGAVVGDIGDAVTVVVERGVCGCPGA